MRNNNRITISRAVRSIVHAFKNIVESMKYGANGTNQPKAMQPVRLYVHHIENRERNL